MLDERAEPVMQGGFVTLGALAAAAWLAAAGLSAFAHLRGRATSRLTDALAWLGLALAAGSGAWWWANAGWPGGMAFAAGPAAGLALLTMAGRMLVARRAASTRGLPVVTLAAGLQVLAVWEMSRGLPASREPILLPGWMALRTITALIGYAALAVSAAMGGACLLAHWGLSRSEVPAGRPAAPAAVSFVEDRARRLALGGVSLAVCMDLTRSWWGRGDLARDGLAWMLISWLLVVAAVGGFWLGAIERRPARLLLLFALVAAVGATLTLTS